MFQYDYYRYYGDEKVFKYKWPYELKYIYYLRKLQQGAKGIGAKYYSFCLNYLSKKTFIQIPYTTKIGKGFYIGHSGRVIINPNVVIGNNVNIATGITIGRENRGNRKGTPVIGDNVWIGTNSVLVGNINIGDDVMIAPLSFVNFDVPSHSIVLGNPGKIIPREGATEGYISRPIKI